tara:strand:- start:325 stop:501 length:177 start_codon:yes stop_codon:yes gene_type:complete
MKKDKLYYLKRDYIQHQYNLENLLDGMGDSKRGKELAEREFYTLLRIENQISMINDQS